MAKATAIIPIPTEASEALKGIYDDMLLTMELLTVLSAAAMGAGNLVNPESTLDAVESAANHLYNRVSAHAGHVELVAGGRPSEVQSIGGMSREERKAA